MSDPAGEKATLRKALLAELRAMTPEERASRSKAICERIAASGTWRKAERVLLFSPMRTEPDIAPLHGTALESGKQVDVIPRTARVEEELALAFVPDFVLVPGLAFSSDGHRLGRGGGFYDRLLTGRAKHAMTMGVCFEFQLRELIPHEQHDALVKFIISG
ncbi:MAG: 5-formyltetrahydrofolate cyclo-ligase [Chthoniobacterales bacterium]